MGVRSASVKNGSWRAAFAGLLAVLLGVTGLLSAAPASADEGDPEFLTVDKRASAETISADEPFTYTIVVNCSEETCLDAHLQDAFPPELAGYQLNNLTSTPSASSLPREVSWTVDGSQSDQPDVLTADTVLDVDFLEEGTHPEGTGLEFGTRVTITATLQAPADKNPGSYEFTNTTTTAASNSDPDESSATTTLVVPSVLDVDVTKAWSPSETTYTPGATSQINLGVTNASNGPVETLTIQEPEAAEDGATTLDPSNPFTLTDLTGFGATMPAGAEQAQVDAYVLQADGSYGWETGTPDATPALPVGLDPGEVAGIRITYTGTAIERQANSAVTLDLALRETDRDTEADLSAETHVVDNVTTGTAAVADREPVVDEGTASYTVTPPALGVETGKSITPERIAAGDTASATVTGTNASDVAVAELRVADLDYFTADRTFAGFTAAPTWPTGATEATVLYHPLEGGEPVSVPFDEGETPADPEVDISGFEILFTSDTDAATGIVPGSGSSAEFTIETTEDVVPAGETLPTTNTVQSTVTSFNDRTAEAADDADLTLVAPAVDVELTKTIRPGATIRPGEDAVTQLSSNLTTTSDYVIADQIVVEDSSTGDGGFWDAFDLTSVAPTQVPGDAGLTIQVQLPDGDWTEVATFPAKDSPFLASLSNAELADALPDGVSTDQLTGIRFTFTNDTGAGFASDTTVTPYLVSTARDQLRSGDPVGTDPVDYENAASTTGSGHTEPGTPLQDEDTDVDTAVVAGTEGGPGPGVDIDKHWHQSTIPALSDQQATTTLSWRVSPGYEQVTISDPAIPVPGDVSETVFDAFDLVALDPIPASSEPYSNGWFLRYDTITDVQLFDGSNWTSVPAPTGGWQGDGGFVGYQLSDAERESTLGVRMILAENSGAREAADAGDENYDPYAPAPGSGVVTSSASRTFDLTWQVRDTTRSDDSWVTDVTEYNADEAGVVDNTTSVTGIPIDGGDPVTDTEDAIINLVAYDPGVQVTKSVDPDTELYVPMAGSDADAYPGATFTLVAGNNSVTPATYVRVTDPAGCTDAEDVAVCQTEGTEVGATGDPFASDHTWLTEESLFDRFDLTGVDISASIPEQVDLDASTVWLLHEADGQLTSTSTTAAAANELTAADLADVVAISVTYTGPQAATITSDNQLTVQLQTQLRPTLRISGADQVLSANTQEQVPNRVFAQSYDTILNDGVLTGADAAAAARLTGGDINVGPVKSVSPDALTEPTRNDPVTVTLGANQGTDPVSTLPPAEVRLTDDVTTSPEFWNTFDLSGLGQITPPEGADRVQTLVYGPYGDGGELLWMEGPVTATEAVELPEVDLAQAQGIRFIFSRADGEFFSEEVPAPAWSTTAEIIVQLREQYRHSSDPVLLEGEIENTVTVISDRLNGESSEAKATSAVIGLSEGTHELEVDKLANDGNHSAGAGDKIPWDLTLRNAGTGYLDLTEVRDALPEHLLYLGDEVEYTVDEDGLLSEDVTLAQDGTELVFTWPDDGARMAPGETFVIRVLLQLQPGLSTGERTTNTMTAYTAQTLQRCENVVPGRDTTGAWEEDPTTCGASDYVQPAAGTNLYTVKGVRGALPGAYYGETLDRECSPSLAAAGGDYYRAPCAANSVIGGTDDWVLRTVNAGTTNISEMVLFDQLPVAGDRSLVAGSDRGSVYRPQLLDSLDVHAPEGTTIQVETTTSADACAGTWSEVTDADPCLQAGEEWTELGEDTDFSQVSGLRIWLDFSTSAAGALTPGEGVDVTYSSQNVPAGAEDASGAPVDVPVSDTYAWNQFGVKYQVEGRSNYEKLAPSKVGVHLRTGSLEVVKEVTGPAAGYAPEEFTVDLACTIEGVQVNMGEAATLTLVDGEPQRVDGIPVGAECTVTEQGEVGEFGETTREPGAATVGITEITTAEDEVPENQIAHLGNDYQYSGLSLTKQVDTEATSGELGPFAFTLSCTSATGADVQFGDATEATFTLEAGQTWQSPEETIPAGASCLVTEADALQDDIVIVGTNVTDNGDGSATIEVGQSPAEVTVTNGYDAGVLTVTKVADGEGADTYGAGPFGFTAVCTYDGQTLLEEEFEMDAGSDRSFGTYPAGTECVVTETATGGANDTVLEPADGTVTIAGPAEETDNVGTVGVTATNTFLLGELNIVKTVEGPGAELYGTGPFTAQAECTWQRDGQSVRVDLPNDGLVQLAAANDYEATIGGLLQGTECVVTEADAAGAASTQIAPEDGTVTVGEEPAVVTLTNTFEVTSLEVTKVIDGTADPQASFDVTLACTWDTGSEQREVTVPGGPVRQLQAPDELTTVYENLPPGADCTLTETQAGAADATTITVGTPGGQETTEGTSAALVVPAEGTSATVTNVFEPDPADPGDPADPAEPGDPADPADPGDPADPSDAGANDDGGLSVTGADVLPLVVGALLLLLFGGTLLLVLRRRRTG